MEGKRYFLLFIFTVVCLLMSSVLGGGGHGRRHGHGHGGHGGWGCSDDNEEEDYHVDDNEEEDDHVCCEKHQENITITKWTIVRCNTNTTTAPTTTQNPGSGSDGQCGWGWYRWCCKKVNKTISVTSCELVCCEGWKMDEYGKCSIEASESSELVCENGGTSNNGECLCPDGFQGKTCELAICTPSCQNYGKCVGKDGRPVCACQEGFTGTHCEEPFCEHACQNGGQCMAQGFSSACVCPEGFEGKGCEHRIKTGSCPIVDEYTDCYSGTYCTYDAECGGTKKCCPDICYGHCLEPEVPTCQYEGKTYKINETFSTDACTTCTCIHPGANGVQCTRMECPNISCQKYKELGADACCLACDDAGALQGHGPMFLECPKSVEAHVQPDSNITDLRYHPQLDLKAYDYTGKAYTSQPSVQYLKHCACNDTRRNLHHVLVTSSPDQYGRFANCFVPVKVVDPFPPKFLTCPTTIRAFENELITWDKPQARDNVGLKTIYSGNSHRNNTNFTVGEYIFIYIAQDFEGNEAVCTFSIHIYSVETERQFLPPQLQHENKSEGHKIVIGATVAAFILAAIIVIILVLLCRRKNQSRVPREANTNQNSYENNAYAIYGAPPAYDNVVKEKLPEYISDPPIYEPVDPINEKGKGVDNPTYDVVDEKEVPAQSDERETTPEDVQISIQQNAENDKKE